MAQINLQRIMLREESQFPKETPVRFHFHNILDITQLYKWRTDKWLLKVRAWEGWSTGMGGCGYKCTTQGIFVVKELF